MPAQLCGLCCMGAPKLYHLQVCAGLLARSEYLALPGRRFLGQHSMAALPLFTRLFLSAQVLSQFQGPQMHQDATLMCVSSHVRR